jgi:hypothetical protein
MTPIGANKEELNRGGGYVSRSINTDLVEELVNPWPSVFQTPRVKK